MTTEITAGTEVDESTMYATYAFGDFTIGYQSSEYDAPTSSQTDEELQQWYFISSKDDLSVSYNEHTVDVGSSATDQEYRWYFCIIHYGWYDIICSPKTKCLVNGVSGTDDRRL